MDQSQNLNQLIALFLAEAIRSRRISLARAAEISKRVVARLPGLESEDEALLMLTQIEKDFEEVTVLKQALHFGYQASSIKVYESEIKDYVSKILARDINSSTAFLQDAASPGLTIQQLCLKYPEFCRYLMNSPEKGRVFAGLSQN